MSRLRMCASSCARTPSSSAGVAAERKPWLTAIAAPRGPRPAASARGWPSGNRKTRGFGSPATPPAAGPSRGGPGTRRAAPRARRPSQGRSGRRTSTRRRRRAAPKKTTSETRRKPPNGQAIAASTAQPPAIKSHALRMFQPTTSRTRTSASSGCSSSSNPRGGQSGSGASQRLEQWSEAMFWSGIRMCPFSSRCATSSSRQ